MKIQFRVAFLLVLVVVANNLSAQNVLWTRTYGGAWDDAAQSVAATRDGGLIVTGFNSSNNISHFKDALLLKTDAAGNELWSRIFPVAGFRDDVGRCVRQTADGGFIITGYTEVSPQIFDPFLIRTDSAGNLLWQRQYDFGDDDRGHSVVQTADGGFVLAGQAWVGSPLLGTYEMYVVKTDALGNVQWQRTYAYNNNAAPGADVALSINQLSDRGYLIGGFTQSSVWASYLIRTDSLGNTVWSRVYDTLAVNECYDVLLTNDGGFLLTGTKVDPFTDTDVLLIKTDSNGNPVWERVYGGVGPDRGNAVRQLPDGGFLVVGQTGSYGAGQFDVYVIRTNASGDSLWTRTFGGSSDDRGFSTAVLRDGIAVAGWAWSFGGGQGDAYLLKLQDPVLEVKENPTLPSAAELYQNYPNPFNPSTTIRFVVPGGTRHAVSLRVYDVLGREVARLVDGEVTPGQHEVVWNAEGLASGVYLYRLEASGRSETRRMLLIR